MKPKPLTMRWFAVVAMAVVLVDQATKILAIRTLRPRLPGAVDLIPRALALRYAENRGAAWSMLQEHPLFLTVLSTVVAAALLLWAMYLKPEEVQLRWPLALILGGAVGNLIDRYLLGHVTDFIDVHWDNAYHFPTFNVADSAICVGMGILILMSFAARPVEDEPAPDAPGSGP